MSCFRARHARFTMSNLLNFFALDGNNPYSIFSCVEMAWNNAHAVRGSLSAEVWESINATRIERESAPAGDRRAGQRRFL